MRVAVSAECPEINVVYYNEDHKQILISDLISHIKYKCPRTPQNAQGQNLFYDLSFYALMISAIIPASIAAIMGYPTSVISHLPISVLP